MNKSPWTPERDADLTRLWLDGMVTVQIGEALGCTKNSVIGRAHRLKLPLRHAPPGFFLDKKSAKQAKPRKSTKSQRAHAPQPKPPVLPPAAIRPPAKVKNGPLSILEVGSVHCRAILGEVKAEKTMMCAERVFKSSDGVLYPYCEQHARAFYTGGAR